MPWLTKWDEDMVDILTPIAGHNKAPRVEMLFFANTFPLAYHYAIALKRKKKSPNKLIFPGVWGAPNKSNMIFYTNEPKKRDGSQRVRVTVFEPRYAFTPLTLASSRIRDDLLSDENIKTRQPQRFTISEFLEKAKKRDYEFGDVVISAEIADLGDYLKAFVEKTFDKVTVFASQGPRKTVKLPISRLIKPSSNMLRFFIYGGSLSSYLRRKQDRYLSLDIHDGSGEVAEKMNTYISCPTVFVEALKKYHKKLYEAAKEAENYKPGCQTCPQFFTVYRSYNEMAWLLQHRSSFEDADEFAKCLRDHHREPDEE